MALSRAYRLEEFVQNMDEWRITDIMLPFLLVFTIAYSILYKTKVFGKEKKNIAMVVALVVAAVPVVFHVTGRFPENLDVIEIMNKSIPNVMLFLVAILSIHLLTGIFGSGKEFKKLTFFFSFVVIFLSFIIFVNSVFPDITLLIPAASVVLIIYGAFKGVDEKSETGSLAAQSIAVVSFSLVLYLFGYEAGWFKEIPWWLKDEGAYSLLIITTIISLSIGLVMGKGDKE